MSNKGKKVGHSDLFIVHDTAPCHGALPHQVYYHMYTKFDDPA